MKPFAVILAGIFAMVVIFALALGTVDAEHRQRESNIHYHTCLKQRKDHEVCFAYAHAETDRKPKFPFISTE